MCKNCDNMILRNSFYSPQDYLNCLGYIKELLDTGKFELVEKSCEMDNVKNENGCWIDDIIVHVIRCKECGEYFTCFADTYHGGGKFRLGK